MTKNKFINIFLFISLLVGILLSGISLIRETNLSEENWIAKVDGIPISKAKYLLQLQGLRDDKSNSLTKEDEAYVLERMIEEELLIRRAVDLGLLNTNTIIRGTIIQQVINSIISDNALKPITEKQLRQFYEENKSFFSSATKLRIRQLYFKGINEVSLKRAHESYLALKKEKSFDEILINSDKTTIQIPDTLMTLAKVREYVGPSMMNLAKILKPGEFTSPKKVSTGYKIIFLVDRQDTKAPDFNLARNQIKSEFSKRRDDTSLRYYLDNLKKWYQIKRNEVSEQ